MKARQGIATVYVAVIATALAGFVSFGVDFGRAQLAKTELQRAVDAAARYGGRFILAGQATAYANANTAASANTVDGNALTLSSSDVQVGYWNSATKVFTNNATPINAIRVSVSKTVPLWFGNVVGRSNCTVRSTSVVTTSSDGLTALNGTDFKNNAFIAGYNSAVTTNPTSGNCDDGGSIASNGLIDTKNNGTIRGNVVLGPSGSVAAGWSITGGTLNVAQAIATPTDPAWNPVGNPGGVPAAWVVNSNTTIAGGTYWFTSIDINANVTISGPAVFYVNGNIDIDGTVTPYQSLPANLKIYQIGASRTFGASGTLIAQIIAPRSDFSTKNNMKFCGSFVFNTFEAKNNCDVFYDNSLGMVHRISTVK